MTSRSGRAAMLCIWAGGLGLGAVTGCAPSWVYTYVDAQNLARTGEKPILVVYRDPLDPYAGQMMELLTGPSLAGPTRGMVLCSLVTEYDPNRKFVAQYGVLSAPALILIHPDGTYHARSGVAREAELISFLESAHPPGEQPRVDITVPRPTDFLVRGESIYEQAVEKASRQNRKLLIIYKWWLDQDSTELVRRVMLPEVASRCSEMVACVLDWDYAPNRTHVARYGVRRYPAMIVVNQDGTYVSREGLGTTEEIVRFLTRSEGREHRPTPAGDVRFNWHTDFESARKQALATKQGVFIFYRSAYNDESEQMSRLLETQPAAGLFTDTVNCLLDWSEQRNRQLMAEFNANRAPAFVAVRVSADGAFSVRVGRVTIDDLRDLRRFLTPG